MLSAVLQPLRTFRQSLVLSPAAKAEARWDREHGRGSDPGIASIIEAGTDWLCHAQDCSVSQDGGVARHYSLLRGWATSYPETTGYIVPTILDVARDRRDPELRNRARRMLDWLVSIRLPGEGFQGGVIGQTPVVPVTFNTGQILIGLASGVAEFGEVYRPAMRAAADWLVATQDADGAWRRHATPFAVAGEKSYETHVAWGLLEAARVDSDRAYGAAALKNVRWALTKQQRNGWFADCCLTETHQPLTHTLGYALRGVVEAYRFTGEQEFLDAAMLTANALIDAIHEDGSLAGRLDAQWNAAVDWVCLTGTAQVAHSWLLLYQATGDTRLRDAAYAASRYVRTTIRVVGPPEIRGGVKGSFPVSGDYCRFEYPSWACKFVIDVNRLEQSIRNSERHATQLAELSKARL